MGLAGQAPILPEGPAVMTETFWLILFSVTPLVFLCRILFPETGVRDEPPDHRSTPPEIGGGRAGYPSQPPASVPMSSPKSHPLYDRDLD